MLSYPQEVVQGKAWCYAFLLGHLGRIQRFRLGKHMNQLGLTQLHSSLFETFVIEPNLHLEP